MAHLATSLLKECLQPLHAQKSFPCLGIAHPGLRDASHSLDAPQGTISADLLGW